MEAAVLTAAINRAIQGGAISAPPVHEDGHDLNFVRAQTDVGIDPKILETYLSDLRADGDLAALERRFIRSAFGGGVSVNFSSIARQLLAQAIVTNDIPGTVARFISNMDLNAAEMTAVLAISGVVTFEPINLSPEVALVPLDSLPPSLQRGIALGQSTVWTSFGGPRAAIPSALITKFRFSPVLYAPQNPQPQMDFQGIEQTRRAQATLEEACNLLSLADLHPIVGMFWVQPNDWLMAGVGSGWQFSPNLDLRVGDTIVTDVLRRQLEGIGSDYFSIETKKRKILRIPLDRLSRVGLERDMADQAIDVGIALEALLLHDRGDRSELTFTLSYRGAWLLGANVDQRLEIQRSLRKLYALRSNAVHRGEVTVTEPNIHTIGHAVTICKDLVRRLIALRCNAIDWDSVVVGGQPGNMSGDQP